ncbi:MGMT family protein [Microbulbifer hydrolyticus]|uniref:Methylated-DNA-protein-cysteine methyltransferase-like protein n=1 Tax=Microbulbifer hydrolyticus TaxID=48074 RepID=A0AA89T707_9GAMM|nr:MGMT family protein [Microbulbifer hydrolyticus]MBB5213262.1 methylated-DNA-protein-cysteine methyltransferase-like protein [Microbulbifer hydrolyticus]
MSHLQHEKIEGHDATSRICLALAHVPPGRVVTYGGLAELAGLPRAARLVGQTLRKLPKDTKLPWHRVVNAQGRISIPEPGYQRQKRRLEDEGITLVRGKVDLERFRWQP